MFHCAWGGRTILCGTAGIDHLHLILVFFRDMERVWTGGIWSDAGLLHRHSEWVSFGSRDLFRHS
jgi:hypothetical protein